MADPVNGGPREWRTPGMADPGNGGPVPRKLDVENNSFFRLKCLNVSKETNWWGYYFSFLAVLGSCQLQSSTMELVSNSAEMLCAADCASTIFQARSLIDCQRRCTTQKSKCYASNFDVDSRKCELFNFRPAAFTLSRQSCKLFKVTWRRI